MGTHGYLPELNSKSQQTIKLLCATAKKGLADCYSKKDLSLGGLSFNNHEMQLNMALNLRYIITAQIGIKHWLHFHGNNGVSLPDFWVYIFSKSYEIDSAGDLGLAIWAGVESKAEDCTVFVKKLVDNWSRIRWACNAVELAWVVQGIVRFSQYQPIDEEMTDVLKDAHERLTGLYCHGSGLFARHSRRGLKEAVSRRIACFADQVYPILALANYGQAFGDDKSIEVAVATAETICRLQGSKGQWWWHYDVKTGTVAEEYPVFSVHQDGMAPMALLAIDKVTNKNHSPYIEKGLRWLAGQNELQAEMILPEKGIVWRDIHRWEIRKIYRLTRSILTTVGWDRAHHLAGKNLFGYVVNRESRPYHLGWILYAWAEEVSVLRATSDDAVSRIRQ